MLFVPVHGDVTRRASDGSGPKLHLAYLRDPDGNKLCALHRM
jgi:hypothetical protein